MADETVVVLVCLSAHTHLGMQSSQLPGGEFVCHSVSAIQREIPARYLARCQEVGIGRDLTKEY